MKLKEKVDGKKMKKKSKANLDKSFRESDEEIDDEEMKKLKKLKSKRTIVICENINEKNFDDFTKEDTLLPYSIHNEKINMPFEFDLAINQFKAIINNQNYF